MYVCIFGPHTSGRNLRLPRRCRPLVNHFEYTSHVAVAQADKIKNHGLGQYGAEPANPIILRHHFGNFVH